MSLSLQKKRKLKWFLSLVLNKRVLSLFRILPILKKPKMTIYYIIVVSINIFFVTLHTLNKRTLRLTKSPNDMKQRLLNAFPFKLMLHVVCMALTVIVIGCSPAKKGEKLGSKYCAKLTGFDQFTSPSQFKDLANSALESVIIEYGKSLESFANDSAKINEFVNAYNTSVAKGSSEFASAYESALRAIFKEKAWYREKDPNNYYLYSLADDSLNVLNCKGKIAYRLHCDTLFFDDTNHTVAIVDFVGDSIMNLYKANDSNMMSTYRIAQFEDLIRGTWTYRPMENYYGQWKSSWTNFKEDGRYVGQEWQWNNWTDDYRLLKTRGTYKFQQVDDTTYKLITDNGRNGVNGKIVVKNVDKFRHYYRDGSSEMKSRSKKGSVKGLSCLFEEKK